MKSTLSHFLQKRKRRGNKDSGGKLNYLLVILGSAIGGGLRYWLSNAVYKYLPVTFPYGTLAVNILGSFVLGLIVFVFDEKELLNGQLKIFLTIGLCGGFTTFSTFSLETFNLIRDSEYLFAAFNIVVSLLLCVAGVFLAYILSKII
jgi:fluoride exporter